MVDIKEPRDSLIDYVVFRFSPLLALPIGAGAGWLGYSVLGIRDFSWLALFVGPITLGGTAAVVYGLSALAEPKSRKPQR